MRKFYLINSIGSRKDLNGADGVRLVNPTGLGYELGQSYGTKGAGFYGNLLKDYEKQGSVAGDLVFLRKASVYEDYRNLMNWLASSKDLRLIYSPYGSEEFYRDVEVAYITKTEIGDGGWLTVPVSFKGLSPWYKKTPRKISAESGSGGTMKYPKLYNSALRYGTSGSNYTAKLIPEGQLPAAYEFKYKGAATNPSVITYDGSGDIIGQVDVTGTLGATDSLRVCTIPGKCGVFRVAADGTETDLIAAGAVDITQELFPRLPISEMCSVRITADSALSGTAELLVYGYYRTV